MEQMKTRCRPGQRAQVTKPLNGFNLGKIVEIVCPCTSVNNAKFGDLIEFEGFIFKKSMTGFFWVVQSLGSELIYSFGSKTTTMQEGPFPDGHLTPLDEFEQDDALWMVGSASVSKPVPEMML